MLFHTSSLQNKYDFQTYSTIKSSENKMETHSNKQNRRQKIKEERCKWYRSVYKPSNHRLVFSVYKTKLCVRVHINWSFNSRLWLKHHRTEYCPSFTLGTGIWKRKGKGWYELSKGKHWDSASKQKHQITCWGKQTKSHKINSTDLTKALQW